MRLLVVGGSDAGISAGLRARELRPDVDVTLVVADAYPNYSICGLPFYLSGETPDWRDLAHRTREDLEAAGLELLLDTTVTAIDPDGHRVRAVGPDGHERDLPYGRLVLGTGAVPVRPPLPGLELPGVHVLHTMGHVFAVHDRIVGARRAVVVGAGYIGMELADALTHRGLQVTIVEMAEEVLTTVDPVLGSLLHTELARHGVTVRTGSTVQAIERDADGLAVTTATERFPADAVVVAAGVRPSVELGATAGIPTGAGGALAVDRGMRTGLDDVFAAGDCVQTWHRLLERHDYLPLGTTAHKQGRVAGANVIGAEAVFAGSLGTQAVKIFDLVAARTGLRADEAADAGFDPETVQVTVDDHKAYYPGATDLHVRLTADRRDGRLLGAQLVGHRHAEVAKRVDVVATAIFHGMTVDGLADLDLSYTPPLSSPWDPVQMAGQSWSGARLATASV